MHRLCGLTIAAVVLAGCSSASEAPPPSPESSSAPAAAAEVGPVLDITIAGGTVTPTNGELEARVGMPITLVVSSDVADELHVHAVPEHTFDVVPAAGQSFQFTVDVPGRVEVELHEAHRTLVTIQVRP
ncbi:hypothetical protein MMUR_11380 [Mycolicibacterium murale]|uniref:EfeO-type cupredoxin-like domain-containing protein n=2 Tax=Mycolicibacterium murale TaxID=182220 RepID=A0A7I9WGX2_9MYCO|nr:hypothetical protein [Mycolicibacterium murale]MCV7180779.1 hypothetical protein [Mycolicibacterium murale]GFG57002.1 hypothetical protein MMUR_11380 [Mycolicibacterium murale]